MTKTKYFAAAVQTLLLVVSSSCCAGRSARRHPITPPVTLPSTNRCPSGEYCVDLRDCPSLNSLPLDRHRPSGAPSEETLRRLRAANCGYVGISPLVCCPRRSDVNHHGPSEGGVGLHHGGDGGPNHYTPTGGGGNHYDPHREGVPGHHGAPDIVNPHHHTPGSDGIHRPPGRVDPNPHFDGHGDFDDHGPPGDDHHVPHGFPDHHDSSEEGFVPVVPHHGSSDCNDRGSHRSSHVNRDCPEGPHHSPHPSPYPGSDSHHHDSGFRPSGPEIGGHHPFHPEGTERPSTTTRPLSTTTARGRRTRTTVTTSSATPTRPTVATSPATPTRRVSPSSTASPGVLRPEDTDSDVTARRNARGVKRRLLPGTGECGVSVDERVIGGRIANLGAFPWIARLGYIRRGNTEVTYRCGGSLISRRYVLTAAHCITKLPSGMRLTTIRLGEHDETTDQDCSADGDCADPVQDFVPQEIVYHPTYDTPKYRHDVGLVRLDRDAQFTAFVTPICLPFDSLSTKNYTGLRSTVAGWGVTEIGAPRGSPTLRFVDVRVVTSESCVRAFEQDADINPEEQLCAGGEENKDSCEGDSGGPLSRAEDIAGVTAAPETSDDGSSSDTTPRHVLIGVVSFGSKLCGSENVPGVYARVTRYLDWILDTIKQ